MKRVEACVRKEAFAVAAPSEGLPKVAHVACKDFTWKGKRWLQGSGRMR